VVERCHRVVCRAATTLIGRSGAGDVTGDNIEDHWLYGETTDGVVRRDTVTPSVVPSYIDRRGRLRNMTMHAIEVTENGGGTGPS
jgi:hypothetical protein